jgi:hypothetical protein
MAFMWRKKEEGKREVCVGEQVELWQNGGPNALLLHHFTAYAAITMKSSVFRDAGEKSKLKQTSAI